MRRREFHHSQPWMKRLLTPSFKFASTIAQVVGGADISGWLFTSLTITFVVFAPPVSHAADYWGRRWLLIILAVAGMVGCIITSRAQSVRSIPRGMGPPVHRNLTSPSDGCGHTRRGIRRSLFCSYGRLDHQSTLDRALINLY